MLRTILQKEMLSHILSLRFGVTFALFIVLVFTSIYTSVGEYARRQAEYRGQVRAADRTMAKIFEQKEPQRRASWLYWGGKRDPVPVAPLSWLGHGLQPGFPISLYTSQRGSMDVDRGLSRNPLLGLLRIPDYIYVVNVVLSLLAILFMFDAVSGEKETGTLRLLLANPVPRHTVLLGKWLGGYATLLAPFLIATGGGLLYAYVRGVFDPTAENAVRVLAVIGVACLYIAVFFNLSLFISTTTHRSATALLLCLLVWVLAILVVPNVAPVSARIVKPVPSLRKIESEKEAVDLEVQLLSQRNDIIYWFGKPFQDEQEKLRKEGERRKARWDHLYENLRGQQLHLAETLGRISPSGAWTYAAVSLTGTGPDSYDRLTDSRRALLGAMDRFGAKLRDYDPNYTWPDFRPEEVPRLQVTSITLADAISSALNDFLILAILNVVFFMLAFAFFLRYDVT